MVLVNWSCDDFAVPKLCEDGSKLRQLCRHIVFGGNVDWYWRWVDVL